MIRNLNESNFLQQVRTRILASLTRLLKVQSASSLPIMIILQVISFFPIVASNFLHEPLRPIEANLGMFSAIQCLNSLSCRSSHKLLV